MLRPALNDVNEFPDNKVLARQFGPAMPAWNAFMALLASTTPPLAVEWRFYDDGKSWLCKATHHAKTICWASAWEQFFRVSFYFTAKAEAAISNSSLDEAIKARLCPSQRQMLAPSDHHRSAQRSGTGLDKGVDRDQAESQVGELTALRNS